MCCTQEPHIPTFCILHHHHPPFLGRSQPAHDIYVLSATVVHDTSHPPGGFGPERGRADTDDLSPKPEHRVAHTAGECTDPSSFTKTMYQQWRGLRFSEARTLDPTVGRCLSAMHIPGGAATKRSARDAG